MFRGVTFALGEALHIPLSLCLSGTKSAREHTVHTNCLLACLLAVKIPKVKRTFQKMFETTGLGKQGFICEEK